ncbi:hypothetical protein GGQ91_002533 [Methylobacterium fujisawaense]|uniref:Uncharacterized protein n=1 Tax=Methylobacterium fujisawaense TaxID=107400 RepID=A0ABR6DBG7_9HYPH|nr:hypothetical protein [Methylobacterium fujisawaense]
MLSDPLSWPLGAPLMLVGAAVIVYLVTRLLDRADGGAPK